MTIDISALLNLPELPEDVPEYLARMMPALTAALSVGISGADPIGTIKAWHKAGLDSVAAPSLPVEWVECNGQTLNDEGSIWNGKDIPDLNGEAKFLRGSATSGTNQAEDFKAHKHMMKVDLVGAAGTARNVMSGAPFTFDTSTVGGSETRPINMSVVWIMRIK